MCGGAAYAAGCPCDYHDFATQRPPDGISTTGSFLLCAAATVFEGCDDFVGFNQRELKGGAIDQGQGQPFDRTCLFVWKHGFTFSIQAVVYEACTFEPSHGGEKLGA
ncbi:hypothetical protein D3C76_473050 [compost metagenome]